MAITRESPRTLSSTSTGAIVTGTSGKAAYFELTFLPIYLKVENLGTVDIWMQWNSTAPASTDDILIRACEPARSVVFDFGAPIGPAVINFAATSTTASGVSLFAFGAP